MHTKKYEHYTIISINSTSDLEDLIPALSNPPLNKENIIIDLLKSTASSQWIVQNLHPFYYIWKKNNQSFILVSHVIRDKSLKGIILINSLEEAIDFFNMDYLTRNI